MWNDAQGVEAKLEQSIGNLLLMHYDIFEKATEPQRVKTLVTDSFVNGMEAAIGAELNGGGWNSHVMGGWVDHYPRIVFNGASVEIGDFLLVLTVLGPKPVKRALFFQAKRFDSDASVPSNEPDQLALYQHWPPFDMCGRPRKTANGTLQGKPMGTYKIHSVPSGSNGLNAEIVKHGKYMLVRTENYPNAAHGDLWQWFEPDTRAQSSGSLASCMAKFILQDNNIGQDFSYSLPQGWDARARQIVSASGAVAPVYGWNELISLLVIYAKTKKISNRSIKKAVITTSGLAASVASIDAVKMLSHIADFHVEKFFEFLDEAEARPWTNAAYAQIEEYFHHLDEFPWRELFASEVGHPPDGDADKIEDESSKSLAVLQVTLSNVPAQRRRD